MPLWCLRSEGPPREIRTCCSVVIIPTLVTEIVNRIGGNDKGQGTEVEMFRGCTPGPTLKETSPWVMDIFLYI